MAKIGIRFAPGEKVKVPKSQKADDTLSALEPKRTLPAGMKPWQPGQSGNPGGKRPMPPGVIEALTAGSEAAAKRLAELVYSDNEKVALMASETLLSRLYGKPVAQVDATVTSSVAVMHLEALAEIQARRAERMKTIENVPKENEQDPEQST